MIFTECPYCDEPQVFAWEAGDPGGWFPSRCPKCGEVMWVQATCIGGETLSHREFMDRVAKRGDEEEIEKARTEAPVHSTVQY